MEGQIEAPPRKKRRQRKTKPTPAVVSTLPQKAHRPTKEEDINAPPTSIGPYLRQQRKAKGISLKMVAKNSKISMTNLELLEEEGFKHLPDKIYLAGYVKSYARLLGIDPQMGLDLLDSSYENHNKTDNEPSRPCLKKIVRSNQEQVAPKNIIFKSACSILGALLLLIPAVLLLKNQEESPQVENQMPAPQQKSTPVTTASVGIKTPLSAPKNAPKKTITEEAKATPTPGPKERPRREEKKRTFMPMTYPLYSFNTTMRTEEINRLVPENIQKTVDPNQQNIYIRATSGNSWLAYKVDSQPIRKLLLQKDRGIFIKGDELRLFMGNINVVKIFLNNRPLNVTSKNGVKSLVFPQKNHKKYVTPLFIYHESGKSETSLEYIQRTRSVENS